MNKVIKKENKKCLLILMVVFMISCLFVNIAQVKATSMIDPYAAVWDETRSAQITNNGSKVTYSTSAYVYSTGQVTIKSENRTSTSNLDIQVWLKQSPGNGCGGYRFDAYDKNGSASKNIVYAYIGNCYGEGACKCPRSFTHFACSC